jgi:CBS domain-containing membrane protein
VEAGKRGASPSIEHADVVAALEQIDSYIDVSEQDLLRIFELATRQAETHQLSPERIVLGSYFSNGAFGTDWAVRQIVDQSSHEDPERDMVVYKVVAGKGLRSSGVATRTEFARWARHQLERDDENWKRIND